MSNKFSVTIELYGKTAEKTLQLVSDYLKENPSIDTKQALEQVVYNGYITYLKLFTSPSTIKEGSKLHFKQLGQYSQIAEFQKP